MVSIRSIFTAVLALGTFCAAKSSTGNKVLIVIEPSLSKQDYFTFFSGLESRGYELTFRAPNEERPLLAEYDIPNYDHVVFFTPTTKYLTPQSILPLLKQKVNLLVALGPTVTPLHPFAAEFGLTLPPPETPLFSHFPPRSGPLTTLQIAPPEQPNIIPKDTAPILYSGINFALSTNPMLFPIINAPAESFATDTTKDEEADVLVEASGKGGEGLWAGSNMAVVAGFQTKSGARVVFTGGVEMFSDKFINGQLVGGKKPGNEAVTKEISSWVFQESMVIRVDEVEHHRVGESEPREHYTTNDNVVYTLSVSRFNPLVAQWEPYSQISDMQLEFTMLDPHVRTALKPLPGKPGKYSVTFRVPDRHGVFKFVVDYRRKGWSTLYTATTVPVVPPRHDEYPRFLSAAWPYYIGAISTSFGFVLFSALWLGGVVSEKGKKKAE